MKAKIRIEVDTQTNDKRVIVMAGKFLTWTFHKVFDTEIIVFSAIKDTDLRQNRGRVVNFTTPVEYEPDKPRTGGRVVRLMPKQLKSIKNAQEKIPE